MRPPVFCGDETAHLWCAASTASNQKDFALSRRLGSQASFPVYEVPPRWTLASPPPTPTASSAHKCCLPLTISSTNPPTVHSEMPPSSLSAMTLQRVCGPIANQNSWTLDTPKRRKYSVNVQSPGCADRTPPGGVVTIFASSKMSTLALRVG